MEEKNGDVEKDKIKITDEKNNNEENSVEIEIAEKTENSDKIVGQEELNIEIENKEEIVEVKKDNKKEKKEFKILGISVYRILAYFIIYSIIGFFLETLFGLLQEGVIQSRKSFLYGPFCAIYGVGGAVMVLGLQFFNKNNYSRFFGGILLGSTIEYTVSLVGDVFFGVKWWDYSNLPLNINGRICLLFSVFWGILAIFLMAKVNPFVNKWIDKIPTKIFNKIITVITILIFIDYVISSFAMGMFMARVADKNKTIVKPKEILYSSTELYKNEKVKHIVDKYFSDQTMMLAFPNIQVTKTDGKVVYLYSLMPEYKTYYVKVFEADNNPFIKLLKRAKEDVIDKMGSSISGKIKDMENAVSGGIKGMKDGLGNLMNSIVTTISPKK